MQARNPIKIISIFFLLSLFVQAWTQDVQSAEQVFNDVANRYTAIRDYTADIAITSGVKNPNTMTGVLFFKNPSLLRIEFVSPPGQVIDFDGTQLQVYIPSLNAILTQTTGDIVGSGSGGANAALASREGLRLMRRNYSVGFEKSPNPEALEPGSSEMVYKFVLTRRSASEGFRTLKIAINASTKLIRRIEAYTLSDNYFRFDFQNIRLNQNLADSKFIYDAPSSANVYNNFLSNND